MSEVMQFSLLGWIVYGVSGVVISHFYETSVQSIRHQVTSVVLYELVTCQLHRTNVGLKMGMLSLLCLW